jgi:hypothetical protein
LVGAWRVRCFDDRDTVEDDWKATYGERVDGLIVYHESGWLSVQVAGGEGRCDAYFGRFSIVEIQRHGEDIAGIVNHEVVASSMPELLTADPARPFRITGNTLVLGDDETWRRICERVG